MYFVWWVFLSVERGGPSRVRPHNTQAGPPLLTYAGDHPPPFFGCVRVRASERVSEGGRAGAHGVSSWILYWISSLCWLFLCVAFGMNTTRKQGQHRLLTRVITHRQPRKGERMGECERVDTA